MAKQRGAAKPQGAITLQEGRDVDAVRATGTRAKPLQHELIRQLSGALWLPAEDSAEERAAKVKAAVALLEGIQPQDPIEGALAAQMAAAHSAAMECLRRAMVEGQTIPARDMNLRHAAKLLSLYARQVEVLDKRRGKGHQKVTVEHVHVEAGGQAIVGHVETGGRRQRREKTREAALEHAPEHPVETPAPAAAMAARRRG